VDVFPTCTFRLTLPGGALRAGHRNHGTVDLELPEPIRRAEHVDFLFQTVAIAGYGSGKTRSVVRRAMFAQPLQIEVRGLSAGRHAFPFALDLPAWLPPAFNGNDCSISHVIDLRLDVDWALDPHATFLPVVYPVPRVARRAPLTMRSPDHFHPEIAVELTLDSAVFVQGSRVSGRVALRTGHRAELDAIVITLGHTARVSMVRNDLRPSSAHIVRIPGDALRSGQAVPFVFPVADLAPTSANGFLDITPRIEVALDLAWWKTNQAFAVALDVLPPGSSLADAPAADALLGESRLSAVARDVAQRTGTIAGTPPVLVSGKHGAVTFTVEDASRGSEIAAREIHTFPDLGLHLRSRPIGLLPILSTIAPESVSDRWAIRASSTIVDPILASFLTSFLTDAAGVDELELSDHRLVLRRLLRADDLQSWLAAVEYTAARARNIADAISALPFPREGAPAWSGTASEEGAFLLPHLPAIVGIRRALRVSSGEQREAVCAIVTNGETTRVEVALDAPLPPEAIAALHAETPDDLVRALRETFESVEAPSPQHITAVAKGFMPDPRKLLPALDTILVWSLRARGERRMDIPYR
jgi:hypothetical protein